MATTKVTQYIDAPPSEVYQALLDAQSVAIWKVPDGMRCQVHAFDARLGGQFRISLTYDAPEASGKTSAHTDTYRGWFEELVPNERVVEIDEFETENPDLGGEMRITFQLAEHGRGTQVTGIHEGLPSGISPKDNEQGWKMALKKLAAVVEGRV